MKAKEEYVDAPRETRSKDITVYAVIFLVLLVGAGIFLAVKLLHKPADTALLHPVYQEVFVINSSLNVKSKNQRFQVVCSGLKS